MRAGKHHDHGKTLALNDQPVETTPKIPTGRHHDEDGIDNHPVQVVPATVMSQRCDKAGIDHRLAVMERVTVGRSSGQMDTRATDDLMAGDDLMAIDDLTGTKMLSRTLAPLAR